MEERSHRSGAAVRFANSWVRGERSVPLSPKRKATPFAAPPFLP